MSQSVAADSQSRFTIESSGLKRERDWLAIRGEYEADRLSVAALCAKHGMVKRTLYRRVHSQGWIERKPTGAMPRTTLIARLFRMLDAQTIELEKSMPKQGDKEAAVLGRLVSSLGKLIDIERAERDRPADDDTKEMTDLRDTLVERIERLKR